MRVVFSYRSFQKLQKLDKIVQARIIQKLKFYSTHKDPSRFAKRLTKRKLGQFSFRIGDYRLIFDLKQETISVVDVGRRDEIYK